MPEEKRVFIKAKMNKDLEKRLIKNGEYLDARNVSVDDSEDDNGVGSVENVSGNSLLTDFGLTDSNLEIVGFYIDTTNDRLFAFLTNWNDVSSDGISNFASSDSAHYIAVYNTLTDTYNILVSGSFLNFSKTSPILGINLIEDLLFFTDNRNQPRRISVSKAIADASYYSREENISILRYFPYNAPVLMRNQLAQASSNTDFVKYKGALTVGSELMIVNNTANILPISTVYNVTDANYTVTSSSGAIPPSGSGANLTVTVDANGEVSSVVAASSGAKPGGENFKADDVITIDRFFISPSAQPGNDVTVKVLSENLSQTSTMKDVTTVNLLNAATEAVASVSGSPTNTIVLSGAPAVGIDKYIGATITQSGTATVEDTIVVYGTSGTTDLLIDNPNNITLNTGDIEVGVNPYYDSSFSGDEDFLKGKFVRFSYRFKFEDDSYSLIAPFTQSAFVPKQDGYFYDTPGAGGFTSKTADSDEIEAIRSTILQFFENSIDQVGIAINMPEDVPFVSSLADDLKVSEIDIIYKASDQTSLKVVDTIPVSDLATVVSKQYVYTYNSQAPIRTLPENEITRVADKAPIRAKAQEISGNRVIYGNYFARQAQPSSLNYTASVSEKSTFGLLNSLNQIQYPNHTLKQNRNYKVGIVLADKYGRQSDVITSDNSTIFNDYRNSSQSGDLITATTTYLGDSLKINFANSLLISDNLYSDTNPTGWYSYKVVVQQQEQDYYNVYLPSVLNDFPQAPSSGVTSPTSETDAFITLFSDNINKVPRDLNEVGPVQVQFNSSVEMYGRVNTASYQNYSTNEQYYPVGEDKVIFIGTRNDIGLDKTETGIAYDSSPFYSIPSPLSTDVGGNPYIARVNTNQAFGALGGDALIASRIDYLRQSLCVYETAPFVSSIDIFYETSTSGLISDLNNFINKGDSTESITGKSTDIEVTYFNSFIVKKVVNSKTITGSTYPNQAVWPGLPWNPYGYPVFPQSAVTGSFTGVSGDWDWYVEESRIRGGYNNTQTELGVRAFLSEFNDDALTLTNGLIYSGLYNSTTGFNETNVFSVAETITKQLDPRYGPIQKFYTSDTDLIIFQEDKVSSALIDKDAIFTADGNAALTSTQLVLGQIRQYTGEYGISYSPLSFAQKGFRIYFTDSNRGTVLRLSRDGLTPIAEYGMRDFFRDNLAPLTDEIKQSSFTTLTAITNDSVPTGSGNFPSSSFVVEDLGTALASSLQLGMGVDPWYSNSGLIVQKVLDVGTLTGFLTSQITKNPTLNTGGPFTVTPTSSTGLTYGQTAASLYVVMLGGGGIDTVEVISGGDLYSSGDVLTLAGGDIGGTTGVTDAEITIVDSNLTSISTTQKRVVFNKTATVSVVPSTTSPISFFTVGKDKIIGGYDNYLDKYTLSIQPANSDTYHTITFNDSSNSWTSFWDYKPAFLNTLNSVYYTCNSAQIWQHYDETAGKNKGSFYGVTYKSKVEFVFNQNSSMNKVYKTINYEGSNGWEIQSITSEIEGVNSNGNSYDDNSAFIYSYDEGAYIENGATFRAGFARKENKYMCNIINNSTVRPDEIIFGDQISGIKGYYTTVIIQNDGTTDAGGLKTLFAVSSNYVPSSN